MKFFFGFRHMSGNIRVITPVEVNCIPVAHYRITLVMKRGMKQGKEKCGLAVGNCHMV